MVVSASQPRGDELASWSPVPATAPGAQVSDDDIEVWASKCHDLTGAGVAIGGVPAHAVEAASRDVVVDRRGDFTYCVDFSHGSGTDADPVVALAGLEGGDVQQTWATVYSEPVDLPTGDHVLALGGDSTTVVPTDEDGTPSGDQQAHSVYGLAGPGVTGIDIVLTSGVTVTTTLQHGVWAAWWPESKGSPLGATLTVHAAGGDVSVDPASIGLDWTR